MARRRCSSGRTRVRVQRGVAADGDSLARMASSSLLATFTSVRCYACQRLDATTNHERVLQSKVVRGWVEESTRFRKPRALSSVLAVLGTLHPGPRLSKSRRFLHPTSN